MNEEDAELTGINQNVAALKGLCRRHIPGYVAVAAF